MDTVEWVPTDKQLADGTTKASKKADWLLRSARDSQLCYEMICYLCLKCQKTSTIICSGVGEERKLKVGKYDMLC